MAQDISGFGLRVTIFASSTFPAGLTLSEFADDADPLSIEPQQIAEANMSLNGDLVNFTVANPIPMVLNMIPESAGDVNLRILAEANRVSRGKASARDMITAALVYPNGRLITLDQGKFISAPLGTGVASAGRFISKTYSFMFETRSES